MYQIILTKFASEVRVVVTRNNKRITAVRDRDVKTAVKQAVKLVRYARKGGHFNCHCSLVGLFGERLSTNGER